MTEKETQPSPPEIRPRPTEPEIRPRPSEPEIRPRPERMERSASKVALEFVNDVKTGAGWTTGALIVGGTAKKVQQVLSKDKPKSEG
jgi:hypothetical protein